MFLNPLHPKKLLKSKWTAIKPVAKNKHFLVTKVIQPEPPEAAVQWIEIEAVYSRKSKIIDWRELRDETLWRQGWV
ncbi:MAG: TIGR02450 family Trp-rich protein [Pusillimonas sp.]